jgi:hypothetical protein
MPTACLRSSTGRRRLRCEGFHGDTQAAGGKPHGAAAAGTAGHTLAPTQAIFWRIWGEVRQPANVSAGHAPYDSGLRDRRPTLRVLGRWPYCKAALAHTVADGHREKVTRRSASRRSPGFPKPPAVLRDCGKLNARAKRCWSDLPTTRSSLGSTPARFAPARSGRGNRLPPCSAATTASHSSSLASNNHPASAPACRQSQDVPRRALASHEHRSWFRELSAAQLAKLHFSQVIARRAVSCDG